MINYSPLGRGDFFMEQNRIRRMDAPLAVRELPAAERPREKILSQGVQTLSNTELLAVLIASGSAENSAIGLAGKVLAMGEGSLASLSGFLPEEFMHIPGIGPAKACLLSAAVELGRRIATAPAADRTVISGPADSAKLFMGEMRYLKQEVIQVALLNVKQELLMKERVAAGGLFSASAHSREIFSSAVRKGAFGVILAHNHPSGDPQPSDEDIAMTKQVEDAGKVLGIRLLDHIIIGDGRYFSFLDAGYLQK